MYKVNNSIIQSETRLLSHAETTLKPDKHSDNDTAKVVHCSRADFETKHCFIYIILSKAKLFSNIMYIVEYFLAFMQRDRFQASS
jgi:hypothetical protein